MMKTHTLILVAAFAAGASAQDVPRAKWIENGLATVKWLAGPVRHLRRSRPAIRERL